jgi:uncharacterized protein (DUF983 family)
MAVDRWQIIVRGASWRCPNCGQRTLFEERRVFKVNPTCPSCGLKIEKGDGAFLGPFVVNYGVTVFVFIVPFIALYGRHVLSGPTTLAICLAAAFLLPILLYRLSWSWWLMIYYLCLPDNLPANLAGRQEDDE